MLPDQSPSPEETTADAHDDGLRRRWLALALERLPERERRILLARQLAEDAITLDELGRELGVSKERVRQLEQRALNRLRRDILAQEAHRGAQPQSRGAGAP